MPEIWKEEPIKDFKTFSNRFPELSRKFTILVKETLDTSKLGRKMQELVIVALLAGKFEDGFKFHLREAMKHGATKDEIVGVVLLTLPYCDIGTFLKALTWVKEQEIL